MKKPNPKPEPHPYTWVTLEPCRSLTDKSKPRRTSLSSRELPLHSQGNFPSGSRKLPLRNFQAHLTLLSGCSRKIRGLQTRLPDRHNHPAARNGPDGMALSPVSRPFRSLSLISVKSIAAGAATKPQERRRLESPRAGKWRCHYTHKANATPLHPASPGAAIASCSNCCPG